MSEQRVVKFVFFLLFFGFVLCGSALADTVIYSQGFEADNGGYSVAGNVGWEWGSPSIVGPTACNSGTKCWGTVLADDAPDDIGSITSPAIALPALSATQVARARFYAYIDMYMYGRGRFEVSTDGTNWVTLAELFLTMRGGWQKYEFDISDYAGGNVYLRFEAETQSDSYPGFYIDDVAVTVYDQTGPKKILTLEAQEEAGGSCPWVFPWNGSDFEQDNDIYSVARFKRGEYADYYRLQKPLVPSNGSYVLEVREIDNESSWTDNVSLKTVDHAADVAVGVDEKGNISAYKPAALVPPVSAVDSRGNNVLAGIASRDDTGYHAYSGDYIDLDFGNVNAASGARIVLRVKGFITGQGPDKPMMGQPSIILQAPDGSGGWNEVGRLRPRMDWDTGVFDVTQAFVSNGTSRLRLYSASHGIKYHEIDYAGLVLGPQEPVTVTALVPATATANGSDILASLSSADGSYFNMTPGNSFRVSFPAPAQTLPSRDFIFGSKGYYIPKPNTFFIFTWDGTEWVLRDGYSFPETDYTKTFDLSLFLPDADGEYKVRVWQDYEEDWASLDYVSLSVGGTVGTLSLATFDGDDVMSEVEASDDNSYGDWGLGYYGVFDFAWTGFASNTPPTVSPVSVSGSTVSWTYADAESDPQDSYEIEIWTGPGGTGNIAWDPAVYSGGDSSKDFSGAGLTPGVTYYVRVKASDGTAWGPWAETSFVAPQPPANTPPTVSPVSVSGSTVSWTYADAESDPQDSYEIEIWTGPGGTGNILWNPAVYSGGDSSKDFSGAGLTPGVTYYVRVKASDGTAWGPWAETSFIVPAGDPVAIPTMTDWGMILFMLTAGFVSVVLLRKRKIVE